MRRLLFLIIYFFCFITGFSQGINNHWTLGYQSGYPGYGGSDINFISGNPDTSYVYRTLNFGITAASISDHNGNLLFCTNGYQVGDASDSMMQNGYGLYHGEGDTTFGQD